MAVALHIENGVLRAMNDWHDTVLEGERLSKQLILRFLGCETSKSPYTKALLCPPFKS